MKQTSRGGTPRPADNRDSEILSSTTDPARRWWILEWEQRHLDGRIVCESTSEKRRRSLIEANARIRAWELVAETDPARAEEIA